jgi:hypothetical protein
MTAETSLVISTIKASPLSIGVPAHSRHPKIFGTMFVKAIVPDKG